MTAKQLLYAFSKRLDYKIKFTIMEDDTQKEMIRRVDIPIEALYIDEEKKELCLLAKSTYNNKQS